MPTTPIVVLEIDDNTPTDQPSFTNDVSMWSFEYDLNIATRTAAETFRNLHEAIDSSSFRGFPKRTAKPTSDIFKKYFDENEVTWLTAAELAGERTWLPKGNSEVERSLQMLFDTIDVAARYFGPDRVRIVFAFF